MWLVVENKVFPVSYAYVLTPKIVFIFYYAIF